MKSVHALSALGLSLWFCSGAALADDELYKTKNCFACHRIDRNHLGPHFKSIAAKYAGEEGADAKLAKKAREGTVGVWGPGATPAGPGVETRACPLSPAERHPPAQSRPAPRTALKARCGWRLCSRPATASFCRSCLRAAGPRIAPARSTAPANSTVLVARHLIGKTGRMPDEADSGAVTLIQRVGSAADLFTAATHTGRNSVAWQPVASAVV